MEDRDACPGQSSPSPSQGRSHSAQMCTCEDSGLSSAVTFVSIHIPETSMSPEFCVLDDISPHFPSRGKRTTFPLPSISGLCPGRHAFLEPSTDFLCLHINYKAAFILLNWSVFLTRPPVPKGLQTCFVSLLILMAFKNLTY